MTITVACALLLASTAGATDCPTLNDELQQLLTLPALRDGRVGLYVENVATGKSVVAFQADELLVPASNVKIVSTAAALYYLGPDYRFRTEIFADVDEAGVVAGNLYVRGNGDPLLLPERVWQLASRLYFSGLRQLRGDIVVDDSAFAGPPLATGNEQDHTSSAYMAPTGAVSVGFNAVLVHVLPALVGQPPRVLVEPRSGYERIDNRAVTVARGRTRLEVEVVADGDRSVIQLTGRLAARERDGRSFWRRIDNPPVFAGEVLKEALRRHDVQVRGNVREGLVPPEVKSYMHATSPPLSELVAVVNKNSNNFMAEQIARGMAMAVRGSPGTWETAEQLINAFLINVVGLEPQSFVIKNASGLHDVNRLTARQLVRVLRYMQSQPAVAPEFVTSLAVASSSGTLSSRMRETQAAGLLRGKTGTLAIASALSGFVTTKTGEQYAFALMVNDFKTPVADVTDAQDSLGALLAGGPPACPGPTTVSTVSTGGPTPD